MQNIARIIIQNCLELPEAEAETILASPDTLESVLGSKTPSQLANLVTSFDQFIEFQSREAQLHIDALEVSRREAETLQSTAEDASRLKDQFMANISHEIRTPMNGILGMMDLLRDTELSDQQTDYVDTIRRSGHDGCSRQHFGLFEAGSGQYGAGNEAGESREPGAKLGRHLLCGSL